MADRTDGEILESVLDAENRRYTAMSSADGAVLDELLHADLIYVHSGGTVDDKQGYIDSVTSGRVEYGVVDHPVDRTVVIGAVVVVHGRMFAQLRIGGESRELASVATAVWRIDGENPQLVSLQSTTLPKLPG